MFIETHNRETEELNNVKPSRFTVIISPAFLIKIRFFDLFPCHTAMKVSPVTGFTLKVNKYDIKYKLMLSSCSNGKKPSKSVEFCAI